MPMSQYVPPSVGGGGSDNGIYTNAEGWLVVPGMLPTKNIKESVTVDGIPMTRYTRLVLDGATEIETGAYDYPAT